MEFTATEEEIIIAKLYIIHLECNEPIQGDLDQYKFMLVRHALSEYNFNIVKAYATTTHVNELDLCLKAHRINKESFDCQLHQLGVLQAKSCQKVYNEIEFKAVFVSPMRRTLQTAYYLFETHPDRQNIKFIVLPMLRGDKRAIYHLSIDSISAAKEEYTNKNGICYDFSHCSQFKASEVNGVDIFRSDEERKRVTRSDRTDESGDNSNFEVIKSESSYNDETKEWLEDKTEMNTNSQRIKDFLNKWNRENPSDENKKIAAVSHSASLKAFKAKEEKDSSAEEFTYFQNCEFKFMNF